ncbi:hypothetical protein CDAR_257481 [Caerostris darwini]|uniref:Uncharacterized protein n=1 Tax=Caerostris darwini TaxID=1538125 RepID=A0AAV4T9I7_9ARAC|nr:hypothetical protein CDAR_257481 [Caerostris darwini]
MNANTIYKGLSLQWISIRQRTSDSRAFAWLREQRFCCYMAEPCIHNLPVAIRVWCGRSRILFEEMYAFAGAGNENLWIMTPVIGYWRLPSPTSYKRRAHLIAFYTF